jgi:hypothetical protein
MVVWMWMGVRVFVAVDVVVARTARLDLELASVFNTSNQQFSFRPLSLSKMNHSTARHTASKNKKTRNPPPRPILPIPSPLQRILILIRIRRRPILHTRSLCYRRHISIFDDPNTNLPTSNPLLFSLLFSLLSSLLSTRIESLDKQTNSRRKRSKKTERRKTKSQDRMSERIGFRIRPQLRVNKSEEIRSSLDRSHVEVRLWY